MRIGKLYSRIRKICMGYSNSRFEEGNILLLSLLVLSGIMLGGVTLSELAVRSIRSAKQADNAALAYYAAESGIEDGLYHLRKTSPAPAGHNDFILPNGASVVRTTVLGEPSIFTSILRDSFFEFNLFTVEDLSRSSGVEALRLSWDDNCGGASAIELSYAEWMPGASVLWPDTFVKFRYSHALSPLVHSALLSGRAYRVRVQATGCDVQNAAISAFADDAATIPKDIPSRVTITSKATAAGTEQALLVRSPLGSPLSGIFDYAVFSECTIDKDGAPLCP